MKRQFLKLASKRNDKLPPASNRLIEKLLAEHDSAIRRFVRVRLHSDHDCDDVVQDLYVRLSQIDDLPQKLANRLDTARNYLLQIASNLLIDKSRRAKVRHQAQHDSGVDLDQYSSLDSPERTFANKRQLHVVDHTLKKLRPRQRQAFLMHRVEGLSYREIGDSLGLSVSTVEKHISAALQAIRTSLRKEVNND